jgi:hypothetical protein
MPSTVVYPDESLDAALDNYTSSLLNAGHLHLYTNDYTPDEGTTISSFTEASFAGYAAITLTSAFPGSSVASHKASATCAMQTFECTADGTLETVYGWYLTDSGNTLVYACSRGETPVPIEFDGDQARVQITVTEKDENTP